MVDGDAVSAGCSTVGGRSFPSVSAALLCTGLPAERRVELFKLVDASLWEEMVCDESTASVNDPANALLIELLGSLCSRFR